MNNTLSLGIHVNSKDNVAYSMKLGENKHSSFPVPTIIPSVETLTSRIVAVLKQIILTRTVIRDGVNVHVRR